MAIPAATPAITSATTIIMPPIHSKLSDVFAPEMHIDVEEANALGVKNGDRAYIVLD